MEEGSTNESLMPAYIRIPIGIFVFFAIAPMFGMLTIPFLIFGPLAAPFALTAVLGDWAEEKTEATNLARERPERRYSARELVHA